MAVRDYELDFAKAILIILVIIGHSLQYSYGNDYLSSGHYFNNHLYRLIYSFHMPLFMMISGYLFSTSNKRSLIQLWRLKLQAIGLPLLSFCFVCNFPYSIQLISDGLYVKGFGRLFLCLLHYKVMWFLFALLINIFFVSMLYRIVSKRSCLYLSFCILTFFSMLIPKYWIEPEYLFTFPFFALGFALKEYNYHLYFVTKPKLIFFISIVFSIIILQFFTYDTYIYISGFCILESPQYLFFVNLKRIIIALIVSCAFMQLVYLLPQRIKVYCFFSKLSRFTLLIYGVNIFVDIYYPQWMDTILLSFNCVFSHLLLLLLVFYFFQLYFTTLSNALN